MESVLSNTNKYQLACFLRYLGFGRGGSLYSGEGRDGNKHTAHNHSSAPAPATAHPRRAEVINTPNTPRNPIVSADSSQTHSTSLPYPHLHLHPRFRTHLYQIGVGLDLLGSRGLRQREGRGWVTGLESGCWGENERRPSSGGGGERARFVSGGLVLVGCEIHISPLDVVLCRMQ